RWRGEATNSLANMQPFQKVQERTKPQPGEAAFIRWYFEPITRAEAQMIVQPELKKVRGDNLAQGLRKEGVDAIKGAGGPSAMASNGVDMLMRLSAYAPAPFRAAMRMAKLPNEAPPAPDAWVPADISSWGTVCFDMVNGYDSFETLFERLAEEGPGTFKEIMKSLKDDPDGPQVDIRGEIFEKLTNRFTIVNDATVPPHEKSERFLAGIVLKDAAASRIVANAIRKCFEPDKRFTPRTVAGTLV